MHLYPPWLKLLSSLDLTVIGRVDKGHEGSNWMTLVGIAGAGLRNGKDEAQRVPKVN